MVEFIKVDIPKEKVVIAKSGQSGIKYVYYILKSYRKEKKCFHPVGRKAHRMEASGCFNPYCREVKTGWVFLSAEHYRQRRNGRRVKKQDKKHGRGRLCAYARRNEPERSAEIYGRIADISFYFRF